MAGVVFSVMVLHADANFAEMGREAAARLVAPHVAAGQRVWLVSQWGFQWYALKYTIDGPGGRTMSMQDNAGLYSNYVGVLMWAWGSGEWNRYELWQFQ